MPSAEKYQAGTRPDGRPIYRWRGRYRDSSGKRISRTFDTKSAALRWAGNEESKVHRGQRSDPSSARMPWGDWCDLWWPAKRIEPTTRATGDSRLKVHVRPRWGDVPLIRISRIDVQTWVNELDRHLSPSMVRQCYRLLSNSLAVAVAEGILAASPCVGITLPTEPTGTERFLTDAEAAKLLDRFGGCYRVFVELMLTTGLRISEAAGLHAARVDLDAARLDVIEVYDAPSREMRGYPKSKRRRSVPLTEGTVDLLRQWLRESPPSRSCGKPHRGSRCPGGLLVPGPGGAPIDPHNFEQRQWRTVAIHAGLAAPNGTTKRGEVRYRLDATPHALRHTYASRLVQLGVPLERIQLLLGHEDLKTTQRYARFADADGWDEVRAALSVSAAARAAHVADGTADGTAGMSTDVDGERSGKRLRIV